MELVHKNQTIGGIEILAEIRNGVLSLSAVHSEDDAVSTLLNLFSAMRPGGRSEERVECDKTYQSFVNGSGVSYSGFFCVRLTPSQRDELAITSKKGSEALGEPVWISKNDWNGAKTYLTDSDLLALVTYAYRSYSQNSPLDEIA